MKSLVTTKNLTKIYSFYKGIFWTDKDWFYIKFLRDTEIKSKITRNLEKTLKGPRIENKTIRLNTFAGFRNFQEFYLYHVFRYPDHIEATSGKELFAVNPINRLVKKNKFDRRIFYIISNKLQKTRKLQQIRI